VTSVDCLYGRICDVTTNKCVVPLTI
jgi:hypothetical protein